MLVVPLHKPLNMQTMPWICVALVLVNVLIYFGWQVPGDKAYERAMTRYSDAGLLDIEAPALFAGLSNADLAKLQDDKRLEKACENEDADEYGVPDRELDADQQKIVRDALFMTSLPKPFSCLPKFVLVELLLPVLQADPALQAKIRSQSIVPAGAANFEHYYRERGMFQREWEQGFFTYRYAQNFSNPKPYMLFTATFLHGSFDHLLGNMIFLLLFGLLVEGGFSRGGFLALYVLSGIGASVASLASHQGHFGYGLGASGAISGLTGALPVLWGLRKVRVFYWIAFFFDYVRVPALLLLPFWLGVELYRWMQSEGPIDYQAHIGGMVSGAVLAFIAVRARWIKNDFLRDESDVTQHSASSAVQSESATLLPAQLRAQADLAMSKLKFRDASKLFEQLIRSQPNDIGLKLIAFRAARFAPDLVRAKALAGEILQSNATWTEQLEVWHQSASAELAFDCAELEQCFAHSASANGTHGARMDLLWHLLEAIMRHPQRQQVQRDRFILALQNFSSVLSDPARKQKVQGLLQKLTSLAKGASEGAN